MVKQKWVRINDVFNEKKKIYLLEANTQRERM